MASKNESSVHVPKPEIIVPEIYLTNLRKKEIFRNLPFSKSDRLGRSAILVTCGDGHVFPELFMFLYGFFEHIHVIADNGGALLLSVDSERQKMLDKIKKSYEIKGFENILLFNHWPCAGAEMLKFIVQKTINMTIDAPSLVKDHLNVNGINVMKGYSIDYRRFDRQYLGERNPRVLTYELSAQNIYAPTHGLLR